MPEGPEIKRAADEIASAIGGSRVKKVCFAFSRLRRYSKRLTGAKVLDVTSRSKAILTRQSYLTGGITNQKLRAKQLHKAGVAFEDYRFHVYRREALPCYKCGSAIVKDSYGGKVGYMCPVCQPAYSR